jgi:hypothetical protein
MTTVTFRLPAVVVIPAGEMVAVHGLVAVSLCHSLDFLQAQQATSWLYMQEIKRMAERYCDQPMHCAHFASRDHNYGWESNKSLLMHKLIDRDKLHMGASFSQPCVIVMSITITNIVIVMSMAKPFLFVRCTSKVSL